MITAAEAGDFAHPTALRSPHGGSDEVVARFGQGFAPRLVDMAGKKEARQGKSVPQLGCRWHPPLGVGAQEGRQRQQLIPPRFPGLPGHRPAALWRYIDEFGRLASGGARIEVEAKTEFCQQL